MCSLFILLVSCMSVCELATIWIYGYCFVATFWTFWTQTSFTELTWDGIAALNGHMVSWPGYSEHIKGELTDFR